jgi:hypothetical protein
MKRGIQQQSDLFVSHEPAETKLPESEHAHVLQLLGELLWTVLEPPSVAPSTEADGDE